MISFRIRPDLCDKTAQGELVPSHKRGYLNCPSFKRMIELVALYAGVPEKN